MQPEERQCGRVEVEKKLLIGALYSERLGDLQ